MRVPVTGGAPVPLTEAPRGAFGASWADDGYIYVGQGPDGIFRVAATGGATEMVAEAKPGEVLSAPELLPGNEWLIYTVAQGTKWTTASVVAQRMSTRERKVTASEASLPS